MSFVHTKVAPAGLLVNVRLNVVPLQIEAAVVFVIVGRGRTVIVKLFDCEQPFGAVAVYVMVATLLVVPVFVAVKLGICPVPLAAKPMLVKLFDHEKVVLAKLELTKSSGLTISPGQTVKFGTVLSAGRGLTVMVNVFTKPTQD